MDKITTTIERRWFREVVAKRKRVELRHQGVLDAEVCGCRPALSAAAD